jgi:hypothetical protein
MEDETLEFFKLDVIDRKVLLWLLEHVPDKSIIAWIDYIAQEYRNRRSIMIDPEKLFTEMYKGESDKPVLENVVH